jgi:hypothetical protein
MGGGACKERTYSHFWFRISVIRVMEIDWLPYAVMHAFCSNKVAARLAVTVYGTRLPFS